MNYDCNPGFSADTWYHAALVRDGAAVYMFVKGEPQTLIVNTPIGSNAIPDLTSAAYIGATSAPSAYFAGWLDEFRISKGIARWTSNFTPPTRAYDPPVCDNSNDVLLLHCNGADGSTSFVDSSPRNHVVPAYGNAQIDTAESRFGGASGLFDGDGDYLVIPDSDDWYFDTRDFTIDFWVRFDQLSNATLAGQYPPIGVVNFGWAVSYIHDSPGLDFTHSPDGSANLWTHYYFPWMPSASIWYHVAVTRSGNDVRAFVNGSQIGLTVTMLNVPFNSSLPLTVGARDGGWMDRLDGWLDELRISKGIARWTSSFEPPNHEYYRYRESPAMRQGWNLIGLPILNAVPFSETCVCNGSDTSSFSQAVADGSVQNPLYYYDGAGYLGAGIDPWDDPLLRPWTGYWLNSYVANATLIVPE